MRMMRYGEMQSPVLTGMMVGGERTMKKVNIKRIVQDFTKQIDCELDNIKDNLSKTSQGISEAGGHVVEVHTRLETVEQLLRNMLKVQINTRTSALTKTEKQGEGISRSSSNSKLDFPPNY